MTEETILIKIGGDTAKHLPQSLLWQLNALARHHQLIIVHGAGSDITAAVAAAGITTERIDGLRVTPKPVLDIAREIITTQVQPSIIAQLAAIDLAVMPLQTGIVARELNQAKYGYVGAVAEINLTALSNQLAQTGILLIGPLLPNTAGQLLNVNADDVAMALARKLGVAKLHFVTDVQGVLDGAGQVVPELSPDYIQGLTAAHVINGGMSVKLKAGLQVAQRGVHVTIGSLYGGGTELKTTTEE